SLLDVAERSGARPMGRAPGVASEDRLPQYRGVAEDNFRRPRAGGQRAQAATADLRHDLGPYPYRHHVLPRYAALRFGARCPANSSEVAEARKFRDPL